MTTIEKLLVKLIKIPSFSGDESRIGNFIISQLKGFKTRKQIVDGKRFNIIAKKGNSKKWLVAHMDTVAGNIPFKIDSRNIFGRGACDNKQSIAASIIAGNQLSDINLLFTVGEEFDFAGAKKAQRSGIISKKDLAIIQEPTNFEIITSQWGVITFTIQTMGKAAHSSSDRRNSAIQKLISMLYFLEKKKWTAFNVGLISGGIAGNIVSDRAEATVVVRPNSIAEYNRIRRELRKLNAKLIIKNDFKPFINNAMPFPLKIGKGFSEMAFFKNSIKFGAGNIKFAHFDNEQISRTDLNILPSRLMKLIQSLDKIPHCIIK
ncbi:MAG TPA: M20/M25/M40 family metallo-hydrolase [Candidatus Paceibacterota bacterium]